MERFLPRIWVFVLAFGFGISISAIWRIYTLPALPEPVIAPINEPPVVSESPRVPQIVGETHLCGASTEPQVYNYDDGGRITAKCRRYNSSIRASLELQKRLSGATIAEQSFDFDDNGNQVGEEILITAPNIVRIRKNGRLLCEVEASSLDHLAWFEQRR